MKYLLTLIASLCLSTAQASFMATTCSSSDTKVSWETGHNSNTLTVKYYDQGAQEKKIDFFDLDVTFTDEVVLREENVRNCSYMSRTKVFAAKAVVVPGPETPNVLDFMGATKKIEAEVICTEHMSSRAACPE